MFPEYFSQTIPVRVSIRLRDPFCQHSVNLFQEEITSNVDIIVALGELAQLIHVRESWVEISDPSPAVPSEISLILSIPRRKCSRMP